MKSVAIIAAALLVVLGAAPANAQFGIGTITRGAGIFEKITFTPAEEVAIGTQISAELRKQFGVVQDEKIHRYVALVGRTLTTLVKSEVTWTFVVLDTDGVNAFAAPGGFIHITRGALAVLHSEAELAGVLAHEITHVTARHTIREIQKATGVSLAADATRNALVAAAATQGLRVVKGNLWGKPEEMQADREGVAIANAAGYAPSGLAAFLTTLVERNRELRDPAEGDRDKNRNGLFSTHPETNERIKAVAQVVESRRLTAMATVVPRYQTNVSYQPAPVADLAQAVAKRVTANPAIATTPSSGSSMFDRLRATAQRTSGPATTQDPGLYNARNVNTDADAPGGANPNPVAITITDAELAEFRRGVTV